uniref:U2 small nuclear ribonucleoprotein A n=1 Tax=Cajanus cajan TaxID=3821 RepID=A0A151SL88_CAJCA|nr:U2 small nuclear ribonucleoprotein A' [Cajanus cajan]
MDFLQVQFDTMDLSDNEIVKLENVPTLVLTNNRIVNLVEIDPLASLSKLQLLGLSDNNITKKANCRLYVINKLKSLRVLDFK